MRTLAPAAAAPDAAPAPVSLEPEVRVLGHRIAAEQARAPRGAGRAFEDRGMELLARDPQLRAALFRLAGVAPPCATRREPPDPLAPPLGAGARPAAPRPWGRSPQASRSPPHGPPSPAEGPASPCTGWRSASSWVRARG